MEYIKVNNQKYAVKIHQQKDELPNLLLLHGFIGDHRVFDHLIDKLSESCNPITVDLLGHGETSKPADPSRYNEINQIEDIIGIIRAKSLAPLFLYGYSMGGRLALQIILGNTELFKGLILESANCGISDPEKRASRQKADAARAGQIKEDFAQFLADWSKLDLFKSPLPADKSLAEKYQDIQLQQSPSALAASLHGFGTGTMSPVCGELKKLDLPVLLITGSADEKYQRINQYLAEQLPNATFSSIKSGHRVHLDNQSTTVDSIRNFIKQHY